MEKKREQLQTDLSRIDQLITDIILEEKKGQYGDFTSEYATPKVNLYQALENLAMAVNEVQSGVRNGKYDY